MQLRIARKKDLAVLEPMFKKIVEGMNKNGISIWNEFYPFEEFIEDIEKDSLYVIADEIDIFAAFGVYETVNGQNCFEWKDKEAKAVYLGRVGVNVDFLRQGIGRLVIDYAREIAKKKNAKFLRLLVGGINQPAMNLYKQTGFTQVVGVYPEFSETLNKTIEELGFEIEA